MVLEYEKSLLTDGHVQGVRSVPDFIRFRGQSFGKDYEAETGKFTIGNLLLLAYCHFTTAVERRWSDPLTHDLPVVKSAVELGLRNAREWDLDENHEDVGRYIIDLSNSYLRGAESSFLALIKFFILNVHVQFETRQDGQGFSTSTLPESGPDNYYNIFHKFAKDRWPKLFSIPFQDFMDLRCVAGRVSKWGMLQAFETHAGQHANCTSPEMKKMVVIRALLVVTQAFDTEYRHSLPQHQFHQQFLAWSRCCYPNSKQICNQDMWYVNNSSDCAKLGLALKLDMKQSPLYKVAAEQTDQTNQTKAKQETLKRRRGQKAEAEAAKLKAACVSAKEDKDLELQIMLANGKRRNRFLIEDSAVAQNAALAKPMPGRTQATHHALSMPLSLQISPCQYLQVKALNLAPGNIPDTQNSEKWQRPILHSSIQPQRWQRPWTKRMNPSWATWRRMLTHLRSNGVNCCRSRMWHSSSQST